MPMFRIVVVTARPSADHKDYFNSIKIMSYDVTASNRSQALGDFSPNTPGKTQTKVDLSGDYQVLQWHAFEEGDGWRS